MNKGLTEEEQVVLNNKLTEIYDGDRGQEFKDLADFERCKTQLLLLLTYIHKLNPTKLALFRDYAERVSALSRETPMIDITLVLKY